VAQQVAVGYCDENNGDGGGGGVLTIERTFSIYRRRRLIINARGRR